MSKREKKGGNVRSEGEKKKQRRKGRKKSRLQGDGRRTMKGRMQK